VDTDQLLEMGERGIHLLFDRQAISEAFGQDANRLQEAVSGRFAEIDFAIRSLLSLSDAEQARRFIRSLAPAIRHVLVLLYFELLDGRLRRSRLLH